jgi:hypothetical protein
MSGVINITLTKLNNLNATINSGINSRSVPFNLNNSVIVLIPFPSNGLIAVRGFLFLITFHIKKNCQELT